MNTAHLQPCTLLIPDFLRAFEAAGRPRLPALERMLARATRQETGGITDSLAQLFGLEGADLPLAPFARLGDGGNADREYWSAASFVHLAPDRDQLVLMPGSLLQIGTEETAALATAFNAMYGAEGWKLEVSGQGRAYLRYPQPLDVVTYDPETVAGQPVLGYMPTGPDAMKLKQLMNEIQMLFHTHAVNAVREEAGQPLINSLWLWGGGTLPKTAALQAPAMIMGDLPLLNGLGRWAGAKIHAASVDAVGPDSLVGLTTDDVLSLEKDWFAPSFTRLKSGKIQQLKLYLGGFGVFGLDSASARRFWRRAKPLGAP